MKTLMLTIFLISSSLFANCTRENSITIIEDYMHETPALSKLLGVSGQIDYSLYQKIGNKIEVIKNETEHSYTYSEKFYSSKDGLACKELFIKYDCTLATPTMVPFKFFNCKN